jgi:hypothetical protein
MATNTHSELIPEEVHAPYRQIFANAAARTGDATVYDVANDLYKKAYQLDTGEEYVLTGIGPTVWTLASAPIPYPAQFVYRPNGTAEGNVYTNFTTLYTDLLVESAKGTVELIIDLELSDAFITPEVIPLGSYDFDNVKLIGTPTKVSSGGVTGSIRYGFIEFTDGSVITNLRNIYNLGINCQTGSTAPIQFKNGDPLEIIHLYYERAFFINDAGSPALIELDNGTSIKFWARDCAFGSGSRTFINLKHAGDDIEFSLHGNTNIGNNTIAGVAGSSIDASIEASVSFDFNQQSAFLGDWFVGKGTLPFFYDNTERINFTPTSGTDWATITEDHLQEALDQLGSVKADVNTLTATLGNGITTGGYNIELDSNSYLVVNAGSLITGKDGSGGGNGTNLFIKGGTGDGAGTDGDIVFFDDGVDGAIVMSTGGNARGNSAVDFQTDRNADTDVAAGNNSFCIGDRNRAAGSSSIAMGSSNNAQVDHSFAMGVDNIASGAYGSIASGYYCRASGTAARSHGYYNTASGNYSYAGGKGSIADIKGQFARAVGIYTPLGKWQLSLFTFNAETTTGSSAIMDAGTASDRLVIRSTSAYFLKIYVVATQTSAGTGLPADCAAWEITALIKRNNAGTTSLVGVPTGTGTASAAAVFHDSPNADNWTVAVAADDTNESLEITVTGEASKTIQWHATILSSESGNSAV